MQAVGSLVAVLMQDKRLAILNSFFSTNDKATLEGLLSDQAQITEQGSQPRTYNKSEFVNLLCNHIVPAIPDFDWGHSTDGAADKEGYAQVTCQVRPQHPSHYCHAQDCLERRHRSEHCLVHVIRCSTESALCRAAGYWPAHGKTVEDPGIRIAKGMMALSKE